MRLLRILPFLALSWLVHGQTPRPPARLLVELDPGHGGEDDGAKGRKGLLEKVFHVTRDSRFCARVLFVEDYDIDVARHLVQGVDLWLNVPRRPLEACGTSGQKAVLNGTLNLSVLDGWWAEAYDGTNGFAVGRGAEHSNWSHQDSRDMDALYRVLNEEVVPCYYKRDADGIPREWIARQKSALKTLAWRFSAHRMVKDYAMNCYLPASGGVTCSMPAGAVIYR